MFNPVSDDVTRKMHATDIQRALAEGLAELRKIWFRKVGTFPGPNPQMQRDAKWQMYNQLKGLIVADVLMLKAVVGDDSDADWTVVLPWETRRN